MPTPDNKKQKLPCIDVACNDYAERSKRHCEKHIYLDTSLDNKEECCKKCADWSNDGGRQCLFRDEDINCSCHASPDSFLEKTLSEFDEKWSTDMISGGFLSIKEEADFYPNKETMKSFIRSALNAQREEIREKLNDKIQIAKTRKRMTPFQDTLFNYEVNVLEDILSFLSPNNKDL